MLNLFSLLGAGSTAGDVIGQIGTSAFDMFKNVISIIMPTIIGILLLLGVIIGIKIGITFAQAEDEEGKKKAKGQLINLVIGFACGIIVSLVLWWVGTSEMVGELFGAGGGSPGGMAGPGGSLIYPIHKK